VFPYELADRLIAESSQDDVTEAARLLALATWQHGEQPVLRA
jgi:hypothetical protein